MAIFCDYENVALGARDAHMEGFDVGLVLGRLLDKGNLVVKKAYADWERYRTARRGLHEAGFELIEIPHVSYSGKNSADIRLVVDALDLCHTKQHIDAFVIVSGDSDFSPLVSKLRENDKMVIGVGVKSSTSDLLVENCDEFIYYDDLHRERRAEARGRARAANKAPARGAVVEEPRVVVGEPRAVVEEPRAAAEEPRPAGEEVDRRQEALELVLETVESLFRERDDSLWGSMVKQVLKRKKPGFNEAFHGYRTFSELLEDARDRGLLELQKDDKSGGFLIVGFGPAA